MEKARPSVVLIDVGDGSSGSGFVVDTTGYILTNEHVVTGSTWVTAILDNGDKLAAYVAATDASRDIALIKVDRHFHSVLQFATEAREGEEVIALGYPLGFSLGESMTITTGIVSAFRTFPNGVAYIQTDTDINFGNSGGPLLNLQGEVVGMNTSILRDEDAQGINFAIRYDVLAIRLPVLLRAATSPPSATPNPTPTPKPTPGSGPQPIFGPVNGEIKHNLDDGLIDEYVPGGIWIRDGIIEALFENPYVNSTVGYWSYGFLFRQTGNTFHAVILNSKDGHFYHILRTGEASTERQLTVKPALDMNALFPGGNRISIVIDGAEGTLYVNGHYTATIELGGLMDTGSVVVVGNYFRGHGAAGYSTHFRDFAVWPPPKPVFGPVGGEIEHKIPETGFIDTHHASGVQIRDGIIEARFFNPYSASVGQWSSGFIFRDSRTNGVPKFHIVVITERGTFYHYLRTTGDGEADQRLAFRHIGEIDTSYPGSNHIRVLANESEGKLYINGHFIADLQLQGLMEEGSVYAVATYFSGHGVSGYSTRFADFTIWPIDTLTIR